MRARLRAADLGSADLLDDRVVAGLADAVAARLAPDAASPWMTTTEAAKYLRCSSDRVKRLACEGRIPAHKEGRRNLFHRNELRDWIASGNAELLGTRR
jgi:excisionase family DNA binding protein